MADEAPKLKSWREYIEGLNRIRNLLYAAGMAEISFRDDPTKRSGEMDEQTRKKFDEEIHRLEKEYGIPIMAFTTEKARKEAIEEIDLARRFKNGLLSIPIQPTLLN